MGIKRSDINEQWAHSGIVEAGDFTFISYCVGKIGQPRVCPCWRTRRAFIST